MRAFIALCVIACVSAFAPAGRMAKRLVFVLELASSKSAFANAHSISPPLLRSALNMNGEDLIGAATEIGGFWDPIGLSKGKDEETLRW